MLLYQPLNLISDQIISKVKLLLKRKDNSLLDPHQLPQVSLCYHRQPQNMFANINVIPFRLKVVTVNHEDLHHSL
jgi:hypothetical protein